MKIKRFKDVDYELVKKNPNTLFVVKRFSLDHWKCQEIIQALSRDIIWGEDVGAIIQLASFGLSEAFSYVSEEIEKFL